MKSTLLDGNAAAAWGGRLARAQVVPNFPVTPQTELIEKFAEWKSKGEWKGEFLPMESEHSVLSAAIAASATGARVFSGSSSQGLMLMHEMVYVASGMRVPVVMVNVSRALSAPISLWCFTEESKVLMADLTYKKISEIKEGDMVLGVNSQTGGGYFVPVKVKHTFVRHCNNIVRLKTDNFDISCTTDHKFYYHPVHGHWIKAKSLKNKELKWVGYGFEENKEFMRGWLSGMVDGDGCIYDLHVKGFQYCRFQINVNDKDIIDTFIKYASCFGFNVREHDYRKKDGQYGAIISKHEEAQRFKEFLKPSKNFDFCRGYLSGIYDAEGTGPYEKAKSLIIYNTNMEIIERVVSYIKFLGLKCKAYVSRRKGKSDCTSIFVNNAPEFFVMCRPNIGRKRENITKTTIKAVKKKLKINDIEFLENGDTVYNIETETHNYIVNGLLVHNCDHNDILDQRDSGWLIFFCENNQEVLDTVIQAYKVCEDERVLLPAFVNMEGFVLSYTREPTQIPEQKAVDAFLPKFKPKVILDPKKPMAAGVGVMKEYPYFRSQAYLAQKNALGVIREVHGEWAKKFGRKYGFVEEFMMEGAQAALVSMGSGSSIAKAAVKSLRSKGIPIGLLRIRVYRPFPREEIKKSLQGMGAVGVIDQNLSPGYGGIVYPEIRDAIYDSKIPVSDFIMGLGGKQVSQQELEQAGMEVFKSVKTKKEVILWQDVV